MSAQKKGAENDFGPAVCPEPVLANHRVFPTVNWPTNRRRPSVVVRRCPFDSVDSFWLATNVSVRDGPSSVGAGGAGEMKKQTLSCFIPPLSYRKR